MRGTRDVSYDHESHDHAYDAYVDGYDYDCFPHQLLIHYGSRAGLNYLRLLFHAQNYCVDVPCCRDACDCGACVRGAYDHGLCDRDACDRDACVHGACGV